MLIHQPRSDSCSWLKWNPHPLQFCRQANKPCFYSKMSSESPFGYPRPDFVRTSLNWVSLNGAWDFLFDDSDTGLSDRWQHTGLPDYAGKGSKQQDEHSNTSGTGRPESEIPDILRKRTIQVPFTFQTPASQVNEKGAHEVIWYEKKISDVRTSEEKAKGYRVLLRFGAVDYEATVWVDGQFVGGHRGGHVPFDLDITDAFHLSPTNENDTRRLTVRVRDSPYDLTQPRGKQYWKPEPESIFYTPSSGIWQPVWLESVPPTRIVDGSYGTILRSDDIENGVLHAKVALAGKRAGEEYSVKINASFGDSAIREEKATIGGSGFVLVDISLRLTQESMESLPNELLANAPPDNNRCWRDRLALWSPEHPMLYQIALQLHDSSGALLDEVQTLIGMRNLSWTNGDGTFRLNGRPYFQALVLDQGYWPDTNITPPSHDELKADIERSKSMGFNGCRKHQKVEDPVFLHWADKLGYIVWGEIANAYEFSGEYVERFNQEWMEAVRRDINHPCIFTWTPVNESWAYPALHDSIEQRNHIRSLYYMTKY